MKPVFCKDIRDSNNVTLRTN